MEFEPEGGRQAPEPDRIDGRRPTADLGIDDEEIAWRKRLVRFDDGDARSPRRSKRRCGNRSNTWRTPPGSSPNGPRRSATSPPSSRRT